MSCRQTRTPLKQEPAGGLSAAFSPVVEVHDGLDGAAPPCGDVPLEARQQRRHYVHAVLLTVPETHPSQTERRHEFMFFSPGVISGSWVQFRGRGLSVGSWHVLPVSVHVLSFFKGLKMVVKYEVRKNKTVVLESYFPAPYFLITKF